MTKFPNYPAHFPPEHSPAVLCNARLVPGRRRVLARAAAKALEGLEARQLMAVSLDAAGWTVVTPAADSQVLYVSSSVGSDGNTGLSIDSPLRTITFARTKLRNASADQMLLKRGDVFREAIANWDLSGRSADEPIVIGAYGVSSERPLLKTGTAPDGFATPVITLRAKATAHVVLQGVAFEANLRNTDSSEYVANSAGGANGFRTLGQADDYLVEDCTFKSYSYNVVAQTYYGGTGFGLVSNFKFRRNLVLDAYTPGSNVNGSPTSIRSEGMYVEGVQGVLLEGNVFDHNGWNAGNPIAGPNIYNHNVYIQASTTNATVIDNIFANASSHGLQMRAGGIVQGNLFINNPIAMSFGLVNGSTPTVGGVHGEVSGNVVIGGRDISGDVRGWGIEVGNIAPGFGTSIHDNVFTSYSAGGFSAIQLNVSSNDAADHALEVGIHDLTIANNIVNAWSGGMSISKYITGGSGYTSLSGLVVTNNDFRSNTTTTIIDHANSLRTSDESWSGNRYDVPTASITRFKLLTTGTSASSVSFTTWNAAVEAGTAVMGQLAYVDPNRSAATYNAAIGGATSTAAFLRGAREQSHALWRSAYTPKAVNDYVRAGFSVLPESTPVAPPAVTASAADVTVVGINPQTITVTYTGLALDPLSLDDTDLRVSGPGGFDSAVTFAGVVVNPDGSLLATYTLPAPASGWNAAANGAYHVVLQPGAVLDLTAVPVFAGGLIGTFNVDIDAAGPQTMGYVAAVSTATQTSGTATIKVGYYDPAGVNVASLDNNDLRIVRQSGTPSFDVPAKFVSYTGSGTSIIATYTFATPAGGWQIGYNATYDITMVAGQVTDGLGTATQSGSIGTFKVTLETTKPTVSVTNVTPNPRATTVGSDTIVFSEQVRNVDLTDLTLTRDGSSVSLSGVPALTSSDGITYSINLSSVTGTAGTYVLAVKSGTNIVDMAGNALSSTASTSWVVDKSGPIATASASTVTAPTTTVNFSVTYADGAGVNSATFDATDIRVTGPNGIDMAAKLRSFGTGATSVTATYGLDLPGGWATLPNGSYSIVLQSGSVADALGNLTAGGTIGSFQVALTAPPLPIANPGGPYTVNEGASIQLSAAGSASANGTQVVGYQWDFDYDGITFAVDATGLTPTFSPDDGPSVRTVALRVTDATGLTSPTATAQVTVGNLAPIGTFTGGQTALGQPNDVTFTGVTDPSSADVSAGLIYSFDFNNDGDFDDLGDVANISSSSASHTYDAPGAYTVRGRVADKDGGFTDYTTTVSVMSVETPIAVPGGPYSVAEGSAITLDGSLSTTIDGLPVAGFEWDFNYDGVTFDVDATGATPTFSAGMIDGPATRTVALRVADGFGLTKIATVDVSITNAAPTATAFAGAGAVTLGAASIVNFTGGTDPSTTDAAGLLYSYDFNNDGDFADLGDVINVSTATASYVYPAAASYVVHGRISDKDGGFTDYATTVVVNAPTPPTNTPIVVQGEDGVRSGGTAFQNNHTGFTGIGFADYAGTGSAVEWSVNWNVASNAKLDFRYCNGSTANRPLTIYINGVSAGTVACIPTGNWDTWAAVSLTVALKTGTNTIKAVASASVGGGNLDQVTISPVVVVPPTASIRGVAFDDADADGVLDTGETRTAGTTVFLDVDADGVLDTGEQSTTTASDGSYAFTALPGGAYSVRRQFASGYTSSNAPVNLTLADAQAVTNANLGSKLIPITPPPTTGSIGGYCFNDTDKDGVFDTNESKAAGKTVYIDANNNGKLDTGEKSLLTDATGNYTFTGLVAGTYRVRRVFPTGYASSTPLRNVTLAAGQVLSGVTIGSKTV